MLREKVEKIAKRMFASAIMALCVAAAAPTVQADTAMLEEAEPNNNPATVNKLPLNTWVKGQANPDDQDWYEINIPQRGVSSFTIMPDAENTSNTAWYMKLLDENRNVLIEFSTNDGKKTSSWENGWAPGKYYLVVNSKYYSRGTYNLIFNYQMSNEWEQEIYYKNKNFSNTNAIELNKWYTGNLYCNSDEDYYCVQLTGTNKISLDFKIDDIVADPGTWYVDFYEYNTKKKIGATTSINSNTSLTAEGTGSIVVKIRTNEYGYLSASNDRYHVRVNIVPQNKVEPSINKVVKPSATRITSIKAGKRKAIIVWKKASKATGYYVYRATSAKGSYKRIATVKGKTSYIDKKSLKSKKRYYYKVVSFRKSGSKITKAKASGVKSVKVK